MVQVNLPSMQNRPINLRFRFRKVGALVYISHLDLVRTFGKIVIRSGLPLWFTEGFNPKPKMVFSPPLSIGVESETEFLDLRLTERIDPAEALFAMGRNVTDDLAMIEAYYPESKLCDMRYLSYDIRVHTVGACQALATACEQTLLADNVPYLKRGKKGAADTLVNIRPGIADLSVAYEEGDIHIRALLDADPSSFLSPDRLITVLKQTQGILSDPDITREGLTVRRMQAFFADKTPFR